MPDPLVAHQTYHYRKIPSESEAELLSDIEASLSFVLSEERYDLLRYCVITVTNDLLYLNF